MHSSEEAENEAFATLGAPADLSSPSQLLDHRTIEWEQLVWARYWMEQRFEYTYPGPIHDLRQRLIVIPPGLYGDQQLIGYQLHPSSKLATTSTETDSFGNRIIRITIPTVTERVTFDMRMVVERDFTKEITHNVSVADEIRLRQPTHLTYADERILSEAQRLRDQYPDPETFGEALNTWIYSTMRYGRGSTTVLTTAAEALQTGQGLCQDYAHVMLAISRAAGIAARYVSGHLLGEGRSHAWVELLVPDGTGSYRAIPFDPTNHRRTTPAYLTIAVGRDYDDISPTTGTFTAPYPGQLRAHKRAGMTQIKLRHEQ